MEMPLEIEENYNPQPNEIKNKSLLLFVDKIIAISRPSYFGLVDENPHTMYSIELLNQNLFTDFEEISYKQICNTINVVFIVE